VASAFHGLMPLPFDMTAFTYPERTHSFLYILSKPSIIYFCMLQVREEQFGNTPYCIVMICLIIFMAIFRQTQFYFKEPGKESAQEVKNIFHDLSMPMVRVFITYMSWRTDKAHDS